ncbi:hypothetical protein WDW86_14145 [Bdellovibrionota bacterium FG-2]
MKRRNVFACDSGQATVEYIVMLAVAVSLIMVMINMFLKPVFLRLKDMVVGKFNSFFFAGDLHKFPIRR